MTDIKQQPSGIQTLSEVPFDVWLSIARYLPVMDLLHLRSTCKYLQCAVDQRAVWREVNDDLIYATHTFRLLRTMASMSSEQLRIQAIKFYRLHNLLQRDNYITNAKRFACSPQPAAFVPNVKGRWYIAQDGSSLKLYDPATTPVTLLASVPYPVNETDRVELTCSWSLNSNCDLILICERISHSTGNTYHTGISIYRIEIDEPGLTLLYKNVKPSLMSCISAEGDLWACVYTGEYHRNHVAVHTIGPGEHGEPEQIVMYLQQESWDLPWNPAISLLSRTKILWSTSRGFSLFEIPQLRPASDPLSNVPIVASPIWSHSILGSTGIQRPLVSPVVWNAGTGSHVGPLSILIGRQVWYVDFPPDQEPRCRSYTVNKYNGDPLGTVIGPHYIISPTDSGKNLHVGILPWSYGNFRLGQVADNLKLTLLALGEGSIMHRSVHLDAESGLLHYFLRSNDRTAMLVELQLL